MVVVIVVRALVGVVLAVDRHEPVRAQRVLPLERLEEMPLAVCELHRSVIIKRKNRASGYE